MTNDQTSRRQTGEALADYVRAHTSRGSCNCGTCDSSNFRAKGHAIDVFFVVVRAKDLPSAPELEGLIRAHVGCFTRFNPLDGHEHDFAELGAWTGDQEIAHLLMGLGALLGIFDLTIAGRHPTIKARRPVRT